MQVHRASVLLSRNLTILSMRYENKELLESSFQRNRYEIKNFQLQDVFIKNDTLKELASRVECSNLKREKATQYELNFESRKSLKRRFPTEEEIFPKKLETLAECNSNLFEEAINPKPQTQSNLIKSEEDWEKMFLAEMRKVLLKDSISSELELFLKPIFCQSEKEHSSSESGKNLEITKIIFDLLSISYLKEVARDNGLHLLRQFDRSSLSFTEIIINNLTAKLRHLYTLEYVKTSDTLKLIDNIMYLLYALVDILEKYCKKSRDYVNNFFENKSKHIDYMSSNHILLLKTDVNNLLQKCRRRLTEIKKAGSPPHVLLMISKCLEILDISSE